MIIIPSTVAKIITCSAICSHYTFQEVSVQILFHCKQFVAVIFVVYKKPSWIIIKLPAIKIWVARARRTGASIYAVNFIITIFRAVEK